MTTNPAPPSRRIGLVGYGYVGRATAHALGPIAEVRFSDPAVPGSVALAELAGWADALFVCVPTPMGVGGAADLAVVRSVIGELGALGATAPILLRSTVPPGTCAALAAAWPRLRIAFHPEFLRERHHLEDAASPTRVVLGWTDGFDAAAQDAAAELYRERFPEVPVIALDATSAELLKLASNALFGVKVGFANEMDEVARALGVDWEPVRRALVLDPRVGDSHLSVPGPDGLPGFGGSCLPKDMAALRAVAADLDLSLDLVDAALRANRRRRPE